MKLNHAAVVHHFINDFRYCNYDENIIINKNGSKNDFHLTPVDLQAIYPRTAHTQAHTPHTQTFAEIFADTHT